MRLIDADKIRYSWMIDTDGEEHDGITLQSIIRKMPTINPYEWISINNKLPEQNQEVLTCRGRCIGNLINVYTYMGDNQWEDNYGYWNSAEGEGITHWMPLPKLPKVKENCDEKEI